MDLQRIPTKQKRTIERVVILSFCTVIAACTLLFLLFGYTANKNALGALASVCMDAICIVILLVLVVNLTFEKWENTRTTKLFFALMIETMIALFFDFLNWAYDGALSYGEMTYAYTVLSLISGSVLAALFVWYLSSYLKDMHGVKGAYIRAKIYSALNAASFILTVVLAVSGMAFTFVDGHYETGALYEVVTVIPLLTLLFMTFYVVRNYKVIGRHDVVAVVGYIVFMIAGALIESAYRIGTTYVAVTIADIFIFVMLQNKFFERIKRQREKMAEEIESQFDILESMAGIYSHVNYVDLLRKTAERFDEKDSVVEKLDFEGNPHSTLNQNLYVDIDEAQKEGFLAFTDLSTLPARMGSEKIIAAEFHHRMDGWFRAHYIRIGEATDAPVQKVIYAIRNINEEKKNVEEWIRKSNTDELTGLYNRHAYEDDISTLSEDQIKDNFVYVSIDVNSLKIVNDSHGHDAGDELLIGACECMKQCFGAYGKLYRTGGDEFVAFIFADDAQLAQIQKDIVEVTGNWHGKLIDHLAVSCGYVTRREAAGMSIHEMAVLADKRMYKNKTEYYRSRGIDRRYAYR